MHNKIKSGNNSTKQLARIAGVLYLIVAIFAAYAFNVISKLYVSGNAAATAANVVAKAGYVRIAVVFDLIMATAWIFLALVLFRMLNHVHPHAARNMVVLVAIGTGIICLNAIFGFESMRVATDSSYAAALGTSGANALVMMLLDIQHYGASAAAVFMGLWLFPFGYLVYKSGMFPKAQGIGLVVACFCYLVNVGTAFFAPALKTLTYDFVSIPIWVFEVWMVLYLLFIGVRSVKLDAHALASI